MLLFYDYPDYVLCKDMKCVGIQYLEAIRRIKTFSPSYLPERDIYVFFVPDEEKGGQKGLKLFVDSDHFTSINVNDLTSD